LILEIEMFPLFYRGLPARFGETGKPIGAALVPATFFNVLLIAANILGFAYIFNKAGFNFGLIPKTRNDLLDILVFFIFLVSGLAMWYIPFFFLAFLISGVILVAAQQS